MDTATRTRSWFIILLDLAILIAAVLISVPVVLTHVLMYPAYAAMQVLASWHHRLEARP
jgi:hypothetical protein